MRWLVVCISVLGIASTSLMVVAPAEASLSNVSKHFEPGDSRCAASGIRNRGRFQAPTDDVLSVDDCLDGWGSNAEVSLENGTYKKCYNGKGNGTTETCPYNFAEEVFGVILASSVNSGVFKGSGDQALIIT